MAHFDLHEQEQLAKVKYLWKDWGKYLIVSVSLVILGYIGSSIYQWQQKSQAQEAAVLYTQLGSAVAANEFKQVFKLTDQLMLTLPRTEYTAMASLIAAKVAFKQKNYALTRKYLTWTKSNARDRSLQSLAILRLASVSIDQGDFAQARELLKSKHDLAFDGLFYENRGDMYIAMGDLTKAKDAYKEGLQKAANEPTTQQSIQMKLDLIGG